MLDTNHPITEAIATMAKTGTRSAPGDLLGRRARPHEDAAMPEFSAFGAGMGDYRAIDDVFLYLNAGV